MYTIENIKKEVVGHEHKQFLQDKECGESVRAFLKIRLDKPSIYFFLEKAQTFCPLARIAIILTYHNHQNGLCIQIAVKIRRSCIQGGCAIHWSQEPSKSADSVVARHHLPVCATFDSACAKATDLVTDCFAIATVTSSMTSIPSSPTAARMQN